MFCTCIHTSNLRAVVPLDRRASYCQTRRNSRRDLRCAWFSRRKFTRPTHSPRSLPPNPADTARLSRAHNSLSAPRENQWTRVDDLSPPLASLNFNISPTRSSEMTVTRRKEGAPSIPPPTFAAPQLRSGRNVGRLIPFVIACNRILNSDYRRTSPRAQPHREFRYIVRDIRVDITRVKFWGPRGSAL